MMKITTLDPSLLSMSPRVNILLEKEQVVTVLQKILAGPAVATDLLPPVSEYNAYIHLASPTRTA